MTSASINPLSNFPRGFKNGATIRGLPLLQTHPGRVFWVCNRTSLTDGEVGGSDTGRGSFQRPFASIARALLACTAGIGDIIMVKAGHAEAINDAVTLALGVAGVAIVGQGYGSNRPTLTFGVAATANIPVTAADMSISNFLFKANFADIASVFTATGTATPTDFSVENCEFKDTSSILNFLSIIKGNATANSMDGLQYINNRRSSLGTTAATTDIVLASATDRLQVLDNTGVYAVLNDTAALLAAGAFQLTSFYLGRNVASRPNTSSTGGSFVSGTGNAWTGMAFDNYFYQVDNSAGIWISTGHGAAFGYQNNYSPITGAVDKSGLINPAAV